ncbi:Retrovirus-related Pol polyprotein from transposon TNT 1-94 [Senna tora]|uniref:Retrovirus-related Pol polyprotein from transposon TNT 1-94 n=1 Tax=Senna tora TaxID=362788 RepID=A0A834T406_9FABA|nr:Retrovirus-related Pol polyprotein from transposon TNT 1-94 [Senna tora]
MCLMVMQHSIVESLMGGILENTDEKHGHVKKDFTKFGDWQVKKGTLLNFICSEVNLAMVPIDTWWVDSARSIAHICVSMEGA